LAEALPDPVILLSRDGQVLFYNRPAEDLFPSLRDGVHISLVIRTPELLDAVSSAPKRGRAVTVNYAQRVPVGRRMAVTVAPLAQSSEHDGNILVLLRDLTEGERINQMRADFIANASHELRTPPERIATVLTVGDIELDRESHRVTRNGRQVHFGPTEFRLLEFLMQSPGRVFNRAQLLDGVWGRSVYVDERTVDVHVGRLRKAMMRGNERDPVRTVRGAGYAFSDELEEIA
jgi:DNA-binding winged helix-turn-helix (wHTH) protein